MYRCLIWGVGKLFYNNANLLKAFERDQKISIQAITGNNRDTSVLNYTFIPKERLIVTEYDLVIIMSDKVAEIKREAIKIGFDEGCIITYHAFHIPNVDLESYMELKRSNPTIFSLNCWGGITYSQLGLEFTSPFINMFTKETDFVKLLNNPKYYMQIPIKLKQMNYNSDLDMDYPVCECGDIELFFNHYPSFQLAEAAWERRKKRINWNNIIVVMYTQSEDIVKQFDEIPIDKKICFTDFQCQYKSAYYLDFATNLNIPLYRVVSNMAWGIYPYYDVIELIRSGTIKKL